MILKIKYALLFVLTIFCLQVGLPQVIKGNVYDNRTKEKLFFANLTFTDSLNEKVSCVTDFDGAYSIDVKKFGIYRVSIQYIGYYPKDTLILFTENDISTFDFKLDLDEINAAGYYILITEKPYQSGDLTMTQNQYKVMPASFQDPARILIKYPGFSTPNDGANAIIFRGMPPETARWQLFGADIVNPNHLSNAGTANDLATGNAGGVNALSGSVLDYYHFEANPADISYADVMSGVSNMKMAPKINSFVDINLIGLEAGINISNPNPMAKFRKNAYVAYRYSFVGLLHKLGINFGNEKIGYQDLSMNAELYRDDRRSFKAFATFGSSSNIFQSVAKGDSITRFKDIQDITFKSDLGIGGFQFTYEKNKRIFQTTIISSFRRNIRKENTNPYYADSLKISKITSNNQKEELISTHTSYIINKTDAQVVYGLRMNASINDNINSLNSKYSTIFTVYPYLKFVKEFSEQLNYRAGLAAYYDSATSEWTAEPSLGGSYKFSPYSKVEFDYRYSSIQNYLSIRNVSWIHAASRPKSHNVQLNFQNNKKDRQFRTSVFYHFITDINNFAVEGSTTGGHFSLFNGAFLGYDLLSNATKLISIGTASAKVYGWDFYFQNQTPISDDKLIYTINGSIFDSKYALSSDKNTYFDARYNFGYTANALLSYFINVKGLTKSRKYIISVSHHLRGGEREQKLVSDPEFPNSTVYDFESLYQNTLRPFHRTDLRIVYSSSKIGGKKTHRWSFDIQNLLNRENDGFRYYDPLLKTVLLQKQLGLIPVLSYRLEW